MKDRKLYCLNKISKCGIDYLRNGYTLTDKIDDAHGCLVRSADMNDLAFPKSLRAIARAGIGTSNIPLDRCAEAGIVVFNTPGANANAVKELVLAGLLLASRDIIAGSNWVYDHSDDEDIAKLVEKEKKAFAGTEIMGKTLGIIGLGAIGVLVANAAVRLGMKVLGFDPYISVGSAWHLRTEVQRVDSTDELFSKSDFITIHIPDIASNKDTLNAESFAKMKDGVKILNFARGYMVNEDAIKEALESGKVSKYVTDFATPESVKMKNTIVIPHLGASTEESEDNCAVMAARELQDFLDNGNISHSVNYPDIDAGVCKSESRIACLHRNVPGMLSKITSIMGEENINIANLNNKSREKYAYTLLDIEERITDEALLRIENIEGMLRVRIVK